jgi:hypothetical protein
VWATTEFQHWFRDLKQPVFQRTPDAAGAILFGMSRAFVKEDVDPPERSGRKRSASGLPPGATNYITARGAKRLRDELQKLRAANAVSERVTDSNKFWPRSMLSILRTRRLTASRSAQR